MNLVLVLSAAITYSIAAYFMKVSEGVTRLGPAALVMILFCLGALIQMLAMRQREMSTLYIISLGFEAIGVFVLGVFLLGENVSPNKVIGALIICIGVAILR